MKTTSMRAGAQRTLTRVLSATGALHRAPRSLAAADAVTVLTLHRIVPDAELPLCRSPRGMVLRESLFSAMLEFLARHTEIVDPHHITYRRSHLGRPRVLLTFDDGWADNAEVAQPHLARVGVPACFFIATDFVGKRSPFWPERVQSLLRRARNAHLSSRMAVLLSSFTTGAGGPPPELRDDTGDEEVLTFLKQFPVEQILAWLATAESNLLPGASPAGTPAEDDPRERMMSWGELQALAAAGHRLGSHTATHALLPLLHAEDQQRELTESMSALVQHLPQQSVTAVSYPNGSVDAEVARTASQAGYCLGFTTAPGVSRPETDQMLLPRVNVWDGKLAWPGGALHEDKVRYSLFWQPLRLAA